MISLRVQIISFSEFFSGKFLYIQQEIGFMFPFKEERLASRVGELFSW